MGEAGSGQRKRPEFLQAPNWEQVWGGGVHGESATWSPTAGLPPNSFLRCGHKPAQRHAEPITHSLPRGPLGRGRQDPLLWAGVGGGEWRWGCPGDPSVPGAHACLPPTKPHVIYHDFSETSKGVVGVQQIIAQGVGAAAAGAFGKGEGSIYSKTRGEPGLLLPGIPLQPPPGLWCRQGQLSVGQEPSVVEAAGICVNGALLAFSISLQSACES